ncbi:type VI lipase adapter Tla3 domain-containing protein [Paraburkholderia caffeinilytica]|uniref:type VI lipase adapter Tla3 domain-containing protein n=1 Tax=Paraburkholderia caffeinilytica TaxID=1761016 RepID=UPI003DA098FD
MNTANMGSRLIAGLLMLAGAALVVWSASTAWMHRASHSEAGTPWAMPAGTVQTKSSAEVQAMLAQTGEKYVLEVRGLGVCVGDLFSSEIWEAIQKKADTHASYLSQNPADYPNSADIRLTYTTVTTGLAMKGAARFAVEYWPIPVIVWQPPKDTLNSFRAAAFISDARQQASLGVTLFLWEADANTDDGPAMVKRLFDFFDTHPDAPAAIVFSIDGSMTRDMMRAPGSGLLPGGQFVPAMPDSMMAMLVTRTDRVDRLIRPFVVEQTDAVNMDTTQYDVSKLWDFYWEKNDGQGPDGFDAFYKNQVKDMGYDHPMSPGTMSSNWWQKQLPGFWKTINNKGPGHFTPSPYIPVRWTTWQVDRFDSALLLGYLHRPVEVKLTGADGHLLKTTAQAAALKTGWGQALATLPEGEKPQRIFYDTTGDREWVIPLSQALMSNAAGLDLSDVREGYDIGYRIGNTGVSSQMVQLGLGLIGSYFDGGASATVSRSPNGIASIMMVSPPDAATLAAQSVHWKDPFTLLAKGRRN